MYFFRHEKPTDPEDPLSDQNIRDRFYGVNDPVADKLLKRYEGMPKLDPPEDKSITTLYIGGLPDGTTEENLRDHFYQFGEIRSITIVAKQQCAFVQFTNRIAAEKAAEKSFNKVIIQGQRVNIKWGRSQAQAQTAIEEKVREGRKLDPVPGLPNVLPIPEDLSSNFFNLGGSQGSGARLPQPPQPGLAMTMLPPMSSQQPLFSNFMPAPRPLTVHYPSQDPNRMGQSASSAPPVSGTAPAPPEQPPTSE